MYNVGFEGLVIVECLKYEVVGVGFNVVNGEWVNMIDVGIVDLIKVICFVL